MKKIACRYKTLLSMVFDISKVSKFQLFMGSMFYAFVIQSWFIHTVE